MCAAANHTIMIIPRLPFPDLLGMRDLADVALLCAVTQATPASLTTRHWSGFFLDELHNCSDQCGTANYRDRN